MKFTAQQIADLLNGNIEGNGNIEVNSVAKIANPIGITIIAGPGVKKRTHPIKTIEIPIKNIANLFICLYSISSVIYYFGKVTPVCF